MPFQTRITRPRLVLGPFTAEDMETIGGVLMDSKDRLALNAIVLAVLNRARVVRLAQAA